MNIHVKSDDPRKPAIVAALKAKSGATKVTMVRQVGPTTFSGDCMKPMSKFSKQYMKLGSRRVDLTFPNIETLDAADLKRLGVKSIGAPASVSGAPSSVKPKPAPLHEANRDASYNDAVDWIAHNDSTGDDLTVVDLTSMLTVVMAADLFGLNETSVAQDVYNRRKEIGL